MESGNPVEITARKFDELIDRALAGKNPDTLLLMEALHYAANQLARAELDRQVEKMLE